MHLQDARVDITESNHIVSVGIYVVSYSFCDNAYADLQAFCKVRKSIGELRLKLSWDSCCASQTGLCLLFIHTTKPMEYANSYRKVSNTSTAAGLSVMRGSALGML